MRILLLTYNLLGKQLIPKYVWTETDGEDEFGEPLVVGQYFQYPFKLAFAKGMTYVALSRCKSYLGIQLTRAITLKDIKVSAKVLRFLKDNLSITD